MGNRARIHHCQKCGKNLRGRKAFSQHVYGHDIRVRTVPNAISITGYAEIADVYLGCGNVGPEGRSKTTEVRIALPREDYEHNVEEAA